MLSRLIEFYKRKFYTGVEYGRSIGVRIGKDCKISTKYFGTEPYLIEIGNHVQVTDDVRFITHTGGWVFRKKNPKFDVFGEIKIGNNVYIGNCVVILPGVTIGDNVIVGARSIVTKDVESDSVCVGIPARKIKSVTQYHEEIQLKSLGIGHFDRDSKEKELRKIFKNEF